jgi:hypothetical protein
MTLKKGIQILEYFLKGKEKQLKGIRELEDSFESGEPFELARQMRKNLEGEIEVLEMIQGQIVPKCHHPKKYHDRTKNGVLYCTNCNMDL